MRKIAVVSALAAMVAIAPVAEAQSCSVGGNLVANCSFENPTPNPGANYQWTNTLDSWNVSGGQFERWSNGFNGFVSKDGVSHLELDSDVGNTTIWQAITTQVGYRYAVDFWTAPRNLSFRLNTRFSSK